MQLPHGAIYLDIDPGLSMFISFSPLAFINAGSTLAFVPLSVPYFQGVFRTYIYPGQMGQSFSEDMMEEIYAWYPRLTTLLQEQEENE